jgi:branched-chain amino acid transport system permease protein
MNQILTYLPLIELALLHAGFACAQFLVLKAGVFSVAIAGLAAIGAYGSAVLSTRYGVPPGLALIAGAALAGLVSMALAAPLARLRGVYQAIATLAFVQIVLSLNLYAEGLTGGAMGLNNIPRSAGIAQIGLALTITVAVLVVMGRHRVGRAFEAIRQDEAMAASLGISITRYQSVAFLLSGLIAGYFGGLQAFHGYALDPNQFGFPLVVAILSFVVLGGRRHVLGPLVGTAVLTALPEIARPLADNRMLIYGVLLMLAMSYMPRGIVDTILAGLHTRRMRIQGKSRAVTSEVGGAS